MDANTREQHEPTPAAAPPRRRHRARRWAVRGAVVLAVLILLVLVVTQVVLWTNIPRNLVLGQLEKQLGLRVGAAALTTGWSGNTRLRDVTMALPLADESLLRVPAMRVKHTSLLGLLWTRAVTVESIELDGLHLIIQQDETGRWNLQEVADLLGRAGGKQTATDQAKQTTRPKLPAVRVSDGTVVVIDQGGRTTTLAPVNVEGHPENALAWRYDVGIGHANPAPAAATTAGNAPAAPTTAEAATTGPAPADSTGPPGVRITGRLAPGGTWEHEVHLWAANVEQWAKPWAGERPPGVAIAGEWRGEVKGGVVGRLSLTGLDVAGVRASGALTVANEAGRVSVRPEDLLVETPQPAMPEFRLTAGRLALDGKSAVAEKLTVLAFGGTALLDGNYEWASGSADLKTEWSDFAMPGEDLSHRGTLTATMRHPFPGKPVVEARLLSGGTASFGTWDANLTLGASGDGWSNMDWRVKAERLALPLGGRPVSLDGLGATVETRGQLVTLANLHGPGEIGAKGGGRYNMADGSWDARLELANLPRPAALGREGRPLSLTFNAWGTARHVRLEKPGLLIRGPEAELTADGWYVFDKPNPLDLDVYVNHIPPRVPNTDDPPLFGYLRGEAHLSGTLFAPRDIAVKGNLIGREIRFLDRPIGDLTAALDGRIDEERLTLQTDQMEVLGGHWRLDALFPEQGVLGVNLTVVGLPLAELGATLKQPDTQGTVDARWAFIVPRLEADAVKVSADINAKDVKLANLRADTIEATLVLADGTLRADPVRLRKDDGRAELAAAMDVRQFRRLSVRMDLAGWPFETSPGNRAELWGGTRGIRVTLPGGTDPDGNPVKLQVNGPLDVNAFLTLQDQPLGEARVLADFRGRTLDLRSLSFEGLDGAVQGQAVVDLDRPFDTRGSLFWEDLDLGRVPEFFPDNETLVGLSGRVSGVARVSPATGPRPLEPLRIRATVQPTDLQYRTVPIGLMQFSAFTNLERLVIEDALPDNPTAMEVAGGVLRFWGRVSTLTPGEEIRENPGGGSLWLTQMQVGLERLDLDQVVHAFAPESEPMNGKVNGSFTAIAGTRPRRGEGQAPSGQGALEKAVRRITADGRLEVVESELVNFDPIAFFYEALSFTPRPDAPVGTGEVPFHLEDGVLSLNNVKYFNRGIELRAVADIGRVWEMPDSPLSGTAIGNIRAFRDLKLPFLSSFDVDKVFTALQGDLVSRGLSGTLRDPKLHLLGLEEVNDAVRVLIIGDTSDARKEKRQAK